MPSLTKGIHAFQASQQTIGVGINEPAMSGSAAASNSMDPPQPLTEIHDSDEEPPFQSTPSQPTSAALSSTTPSTTSSHKHKYAALVSVSKSFQSFSFRSSPSEKWQHGSGVAVLGGIKDSIDEFKSIMRSSMPVTQIRAADLGTTMDASG
jgi:hypothetical protein